MGNFCDISSELHFAEKFKIAKSAKQHPCQNNPLKLYLGNFVEALDPAQLLMEVVYGYIDV